MKNLIYDAGKIENLIDDMTKKTQKYIDEASDYYNQIMKFINNDKFRGESAEASKSYMSDKEIELLDLMVEAHKNRLSLYTHMQDSFHANVDPDPKARIEMSALKQAQKDFTEFFEEIDVRARDIESEVAEIRSKYGHLGDFTQPRFDYVREAAREIIGGDGKRGFINECMDKFINFDIDETNYAKQMDFSGYAKEIADKIDRIDAALVDVTVLNPDVDTFNLFMIKFKNKAFAMKKYMEHLDSMYKYLLGYKGNCTVCKYDPVNMCSGNYINEHTDISLKGRYKLEFKRFYNALELGEKSLGVGWTHSFEKRIYEAKDGIKIDYPDGSTGSFTCIDEKKQLYMEDHGEPGTLTKLAEGYVLRQDSGAFERYDVRGYLVAFGDNDGENVSLIYEESDCGKRLLSKAVAKNSNTLTFSYYKDGNNLGLIEKVTDHSGRSVSYAYENRRLTTITEPDGAVRKFTYDSENRIKDVINPKGITSITNEYDSEGRTVKQSFPDSTVMTYEYDDEKKICTATEQNGNKVIYTHDELGRHTKTSYYDGQESYTYNSRNQKISFTDKRGNTTRFSYDNKGHLTKMIDAMQNKTSITYRADGKPLAVKGAKGEEYHYEYDLDGKLFEIRNPLNETNRFFYNKGNLIKAMNANGAATLFSYDGRGNVNTVEDPDGVRTSYEYDDLNRVIKTISPSGEVTTFEYDSADRITRTVDALGNERIYTYDASGKVTSVTEPDKTRKNFDINVMGKVSRVVDQAGRVTEIKYNVMGKQEKVCLPNGGVILYEYDPLMRLTKVTDPEGRTRGYDYDKNGNVVAEYIGDIKVRALEYDVMNRVTKETDALGHTRSYTYDEAGRVNSVTDTLGNKSTREYDLLGRLTKEIDPLGNETSYTYTKLGNVETITDAANRVRRFEYTRGGKLTAIYFCNKLEQELSYDNAGRVSKRIFADGYEISYNYDALSRIEKVNGTDGRTVSYEYDAMGRATKVSDSDKDTLYTYTATGCLKSVVDALSNETVYTYDCLDNLKSIHRIDGRADEKESKEDRLPKVGEDGHVTIYSYNLAGQLTEVTDALGQKEIYEYDQYGRLVTKVDRDNYSTAYSYNDLGRVTRVDYADGKSVALSYDELGRLNKFTDWLGTTSIQRDILGRVLSVNDYNNKSVFYNYGELNERTEIVYPDGRTVDYIYDDERKLRELVNGSEKTSYDYDEYGRLIEKTLPNGNAQKFDYFTGGMLKSLEMYDSKGLMDRYTYGYDTRGNRTTVNRFRRDLENVSGEYIYGYDLENRLTEVSLDGELIRKYEYDAFGNRSRFIDNDELTTYSYDDLDRLIESVNDSKAVSFEYDKRGNRIAEYENGLLNKTFTFDATNMLSKVVDNTNAEATYTYNGMGKRVAITKPDEQIEFLLDLTKDYHNMLERSVNGMTESYIYDSNVVSMSKSDEDYFYMLDELGSGMYMTGTDGAVVGTYAYDEFGRTINPGSGKHDSIAYTKIGNIIQPLAFTGYQHDEMTDSYFAQARYYDAEAGRFVSEDKVRGYKAKPDSINHYLYCWNRPANLVDLNGLSAVDAVIFNNSNVSSGCLADTVSFEGNSNNDDYVGAVYLLNEDGALGAGHAAIALVKENGRMDVFSIGGEPNVDISIYNNTVNGVQMGTPTIMVNDVSITGYLGTHVNRNGEEQDMSYRYLIENSAITHDTISNNGVNTIDEYTHFIYIPINNEQGVDMYNEAMRLREGYIQNGTHYNVLTNNCNQNVQMILAAGEMDFAPSDFDWLDTCPNNVYKNMVKDIISGKYDGYYFGELSELGTAYEECDG
ncbi:MAG: hypothetical protein J6Y86_10130 [Pseudobutyrivibrio sp.]|nr:hypothetical protein [Pseudobutyrivibrio sp.]